jgi:hypothetical protein
MTTVYIFFGIFVIVVLAIVGGITQYNNHAQQVAEQQANATPSPGPNANASPIPIQNGEALGAPAFRSPIRINGGVPIDGIRCETGEESMTLALHIHSHLAIFFHGKQLQVPEYVGAAAIAPRQGCLYWIHTHDASGVIHIESPQIQSPGGGPFTLGEFFDIWGQPLTSDDVAGKRGPVTAYVNGMQWHADLRTIPLLSHQLITLEIGTPLVPPPNYAFPYGD